MRPRRVLGLGPVFAPGGAWLALACLVAAGLACIRLRHPGLWWDEIHMARLAQEPWPTMLSRLHSEGLPPVAYILQKCFVDLLGVSEIALRLPSVLAGVGAVALAYWAFRPVLNERLSAATTWLLAIAPQFQLVARIGRGWAIATVVAMFAHGLFVRLAVKRGRPRSWLLYGLAIALLVLTSYEGLCLGIAHGIWAAAEHGRRPRLWKAWLVASIAGVLLAAPFLASGLRNVAAREFLPGTGSWPVGLTLMLGYEFHAVTASELLTPWHPLGALALAAGAGLLLLGGLAAVRRGLGRSVLVPAFSALALAWILLGTFGGGVAFVGMPARTLFLWPFVTVVLALGVLDPWQPRNLRIALMAAMLVGWAGAWLNLDRARGWLNPIYLTPGREVAAAIAAQAGPGDAVVAGEDTGVPWYLQRAGAPQKVVSGLSRAGLEAVLADVGCSQVWQVRLSRDLSARHHDDGGSLGELARWGQPVDSTGWLMADPWSAALRSRVLGFPDHRYRITLVRWERGADASEGTRAMPGR